jgi:hypothetical protein
MKWDYLDIPIQLVRPISEISQTVDPGPAWQVGGHGESRTIQEILKEYGTNDWELVSLVPLSWINFDPMPDIGFPFAYTLVNSYRAVFKRLKQHEWDA